MSTNPPPMPHQGTDATGGLIPYKNVPALVGYYLSIFSLIPILGAFTGIAAIICGIVGFKNYKRNRMRRGQIHAWVAIILGSIIVGAHAFGLIITVTK